MFQLSRRSLILAFILISFTAAEAQISDTIPPQITCPPNVALTLAPGACDSTQVYQVQYSDNLPGAILIQALGRPSGSKFPIGKTVNYYVALDAAGNTSTCQFEVNVYNFITPLSCKDQISVKLGPDCSVSPSLSDLMYPNSFGCPDNYVKEVDRTPPFGNGPWQPANFSYNDLNKLYTFRIRLLDNGNTCWGQLLVVDSLKPTISCPDITVSCAVESTTPQFLRDSLGISTAFPTVSDNCQLNAGTPTFVDIVQNLPCVPTSNGVRKTITRSWTATDIVGNKSTCTQVIRLKADLNTIVGPSDTSYYQCTAPFAPLSATGTPYFQVGTRRYPALQSVICNVDAEYYDTLQAAGICAGTRLYQRTWKLYDYCGEQPISSHPVLRHQLIYIADTTKPLIQCPDDITLALPINDCKTSIGFPDVLINDLCGEIASFDVIYEAQGVPVQVQGSLDSLPSGTLGIAGLIDAIPSGRTHVVYKAEDSCGNTGSCSFNLDIWDLVPPKAVCDTQLVVFLNGQGNAFLNADALNKGSTDDCANLYFAARRLNPGACQGNSVFYKKLEFCCADKADTIPVQLRVYDVVLPQGDTLSSNFGTGQFSTCNTQIIVRDTISPKCLAPVDTVVLCKNFNPYLFYGFAQAISCEIDTMVVQNDYSAFDSICKKGIIFRNFSGLHHGVPIVSCQQKVTVTYSQEYNVRFPNDFVIQNCTVNTDFGTPVIQNSSCAKIKYTYTETSTKIVPDACYYLDRTWKVINECQFDSLTPLQFVPNPQPNPITNHADNLIGPVVSHPNTSGVFAPSIVKINATDPQTTNFSTFWSATTNGYTYKQRIKIIDTEKPFIENCPVTVGLALDSTNNDALLWNDLTLYDSLAERHDLAEGSSAYLGILAGDLCAKSDVSVSFLLFLDLNGDNKQETVVNGTQPIHSSPGSILVGNAMNPNYTGGTPLQFDKRNVPIEQLYRFDLKTTVVNDKIKAEIAWNTAENPLNFVPVQLPYGRHKIRWLVEDLCGNSATCEYYFTIQDGKPPVIQCAPNLVADLGPNHKTQVNLSEALLIGYDNYPPSFSLPVSIVRSDVSTDPFPNGVGYSSAFFECNDIGNQGVNVYIRDLSGFVSYCSTQITVQDSLGYCLLPPVSNLITMQVFTPNNEGIPNVTFKVVDPNSLNTYNNVAVSDSLGKASGDLGSLPPLPITARVVPEKNIDFLNGVSTFDMVLISRHVLGISPIPSPYLMIAADINRSNSITSFDIIEGRRLILGINDKFASNSSWRFLPVNFNFVNPLNPFQGQLIESIPLSENAFDFFGIKIGDVNGNVSTDSAFHADARYREKAIFPLEDQLFVTGSEVDVRIAPAEPLVGYQYSLEFGEGLELLRVVPDENLSADHFAQFPNCLTASVEFGAKGVHLIFKAKKTGKLSDHIRFSDFITPLEAYGIRDELRIPTLHFTDRARKGLELMQNVPNPFQSNSIIGFFLPEAGMTRTSIFDVQGRLVWNEYRNRDAGYQQMLLDENIIPEPGWYIYRIETSRESAWCKMLRY